MSYSTYTIYGFGFCVSDISTTPEKLLKLSAMKPFLYNEVRKFLSELYPEGYEDKNLTMDDFEDFDPDYGMPALVYILQYIINDKAPVIWADDWDNNWYILLEPMYPWSKVYSEYRYLTEDRLTDIFMQYLTILNDDNSLLPSITYQEVHNGG